MKLKTLSLVILMVLSCKAQEVIPRHIGDFTIKVTPPDNEYYQAPTERSRKGTLPDFIKQEVKLISPDKSEISEWDVNSDSVYSVKSNLGEERYYFTIKKNGKLSYLEFRNYSLHEQESPGQMVIKGTMKTATIGEIPSNAVSKLNKLGYDIKSSKALETQTLDGGIFILEVGDIAFFIRPNGQIQAAGSISKGALKENDSSNNKSLDTDAEVMHGCDSLLSKYRNRFNIGNQIKRVESRKVKSGKFRFIVMGDSRSNPDVWSSIIAHISELRPRPVFIVNTGDLVPRGYAEQFADYFVPPLLKTNIPFLVVVGNHDCGVRDSAVEFRYLFGKNSLNYYFDYGKFRFVMFDNVSRQHENGEKLPWLEKTFASTPKGYSIFVFAHQPPPVVPRWAWHAWDETKSANKFVELITKYHVKYVFLGHIHAYSTATINGIPYTVSGGGGAELYMGFGKEGSVHHYIICDTKPDGTIKQQVVKFYGDKQ